MPARMANTSVGRMRDRGTPAADRIAMAPQAVARAIAFSHAPLTGGGMRAESCRATLFTCPGGR